MKHLIICYLYLLSFLSTNKERTMLVTLNLNFYILTNEVDVKYKVYNLLHKKIITFELEKV